MLTCTTMRRALVALLACVGAADPEVAKVRLIVLSGPRTGSSLLIETLRRHESILLHGEIFHEDDLRKSEKDGFDGGLVVGDDVFHARHRDPRVLLDFVGAHGLGRTVVGFKLFSEHLEWQFLPTFLRWSTHVVVLQRTHMLAQYVSICVAQKNNDWVQHERRRSRVEPVAVDVTNFDSWRHREVAFAREARRVADASAGAAPAILAVNYEEDLCMPEQRVAILARLAAFLDLAPFADVVHGAGLPVKQHDHTLLAAFVTNWAALPPVMLGEYAHLPTGCRQHNRPRARRRRLSGDDGDDGACPQAGYEFANYLEPYEVAGLGDSDEIESRAIDKIEPALRLKYVGVKIDVRGERFYVYDVAWQAKETAWAIYAGPLEDGGAVDRDPDARLAIFIDGFLHQLIAASAALNPGVILRKNPG